MAQESMTGLQYLPGGLAGSGIGFALGLVGGGGSVLAVPLPVSVAGIDDPHAATGTSSLAVAANALTVLVAIELRYPTTSRLGRR